MPTNLFVPIKLDPMRKPFFRVYYYTNRCCRRSDAAVVKRLKLATKIIIYAEPVLRWRIVCFYGKIHHTKIFVKFSFVLKQNGGKHERRR